jgi:hypothetical protein
VKEHEKNLEFFFKIDYYSTHMCSSCLIVTCFYIWNEYFYIWESSKLLCYELIKEAHSIKIKFELGRQPPLINMDHSKSHGFFY